MLAVAKLELDDVDVGILAFLSDVPESTTSDIAKTLFKRTKELPPYNLRKLDCFIRYRLKRFYREGIVKQAKKEGKYRYSVDQKKVFFGDGVLRLNGLGEVEMGYFVVIKKKNETVAKSIDDYESRIGAKKFYEQAI
jgi:hypothetical protein